MAYQIGTYTLFNKNTTLAKISLALILILLTSTIAATQLVKSTPRQEPSGLASKIPDLSFVATSSLAAKENNMSYNPPHTGDDQHDDNGNEGGVPNAVNAQRVNKDYNKRPQDETMVTVNPNTGTVLRGANAYATGRPIGGGVYTGPPFPGDTYFPPFSLMCAGGTGSNCIYSAPPIATGDPALAYSQRYNEYYYTSIGFSNDNCASGVYFYRSFNGLDWTRPINKRFAPTTTGGGIRTVTYWDGGTSGLDCSIFNDKEWIAVDNTPTSPFYGRIYVTWSQFHFDFSGAVYISSPIVLAYSVDRGETFSDPIDVTGSILTNPNCTFFKIGRAHV